MRPAAPASLARAHALGPNGGCSAGGGPVGLGVTVSCSVMAGEGGWSSSASASIGVGIDLDVDIRPGQSYVRAVVGAAASVTYSIQSTEPLGASINVNFSGDLGEEPAIDGDVQVGPVPVFYEVLLNENTSISGAITGPFTATATLSASVLSGMDTRTGPFSIPSGHAGGTFTSPGVASVGLSINPLNVSLALRLEGLLSMSVGIGPSFGIMFDGCTATVSAGFSATAGLTIGRFGLSVGFSLPSLGLTLGTFTIPIRNCAVWSGTMSLHRNFHALTPEGKPATDLNYSEAITVGTPASTLPPTDDTYATTGSGSGATIGHTYTTCSPSADLIDLTTTTNWGGDLSGTPRAEVLQQGDFVHVNYSGAQAKFPDATRTTIGCTSTDTVDVPQTSGFFMLGVQGAPPEDPLSWSGVIINIPISPGQTAVSGARSFVDQSTSVTDHSDFTYSFTKTCSMGGTTC